MQDNGYFLFLDLGDLFLNERSFEEATRIPVGPASTHFPDGHLVFNENLNSTPQGPPRSVNFNLFSPVTSATPLNSALQGVSPSWLTKWIKKRYSLRAGPVPQGDNIVLACPIIARPLQAPGQRIDGVEDLPVRGFFVGIGHDQRKAALVRKPIDAFADRRETARPCGFP